MLIVKNVKGSNTSNYEQPSDDCWRSQMQKKAAPPAYTLKKPLHMKMSSVN
jgi:hypothetical protein